MANPIRQGGRQWNRPLVVRRIVRDFEAEMLRGHHHLLGVDLSERPDGFQLQR